MKTMRYAMLLALLMASAAVSAGDLLERSFRPLTGKQPVDLAQAYGGQVLLIVNTASKCGLAPQFEGLEALHARYRDRGLVVLGFPSNDFAQETGSNTEIAQFCENTFGVRFPMFAKSHVKGGEALPLYRQLAAASAGQTPRWNFHKYLVSRSGKVVGSYGSSVEPHSKALIQAIEQQLAAPR